jgi:hypothetical protein
MVIFYKLLALGFLVLPSAVALAFRWRHGHGRTWFNP